jgi:hypothetical protein
MKTLILETFERLKPASMGQMERIYKVVKIKNTVLYHPGQELDKNTVDSLCENNGWDVTIVAPSTRK